MAKRKKKPKIYYWLLGITLILLLFGLVMIFSASYVSAYTLYQDSFYYFKRQAFSVLLGLLLLYLFSRFDYHKLSKLSYPLIFVSALLLVLILTSDLGKSAGGATRAFSFGIFTFQPSELAKLAVVIYTASLLSQKKGQLGKLTHLLLPLLLVVSIVASLVLFQPDLGTTFLICFTVFVMMFLAGAQIWHLLGIGTLGAVATFAFIFSAPYRKQRFLGFFDPWKDPQGSGFQIIQSWLALGSGGIRGFGLTGSRQKFFYLPAPYTDFILSIIGEELGLGATLAVVLAFCILGVAGIIIANRARDFLGRILAGGITTLVLTQALVNMGSVTGVVPITGVTLPFVSYGGSSLIFTLAEVGILLNISTQQRRSKKASLRNSRRRRIHGEGSNLRRGNRRTHSSRNRSSGRTFRREA